MPRRWSAALILGIAATCAVWLSAPDAAAAPGDVAAYAGGGVGDGAAPLNASLHPGGVAADASGNLYIADTSNCRVRLLTTGGVISTIAGTGTCGYSGDGGFATAARLNFPQSVAVSASGDVYIADTANCRVRRVDTGGTITTFAGTGVCVLRRRRWCCHRRAARRTRRRGSFGQRCVHRG